MSTAFDTDDYEEQLIIQRELEAKLNMLFQNRPNGHTTRKIKLARDCDRCGAECHAGETMEYTVGLADGGFFTTYECFICVNSTGRRF